jgi:hypothetical protein
MKSKEKKHERIKENQKINLIRDHNMKTISKQEAEDRVKGMKFRLAEHFGFDNAHCNV